MKHTFKKLMSASAVMIALTLGSTVFALSINDPGVVGTYRPPEPASEVDEASYVNQLLGMGANEIVIIGSRTYETSATDYNGSVSSVGAVQDESGNLVVPTGWEFVTAKYDGPNGGGVVYYLGGASITLQATSAGLWVNTAGQGYGLSHFTVFNRVSVPEGGSLVVLVGLTFTALALAHRRLCHS